MPRADANILLRYLTNEPADQAERAARLFGRVAAGQLTLVLDEITVAEVVWTLSSFYKMSKRDIAETLLPLLAAAGVACRGGGVVERALVLFEEKNVDFADALLCAHMLEDGETELYSFDHHFDRLAGIRRIEPA